MHWKTRLPQCQEAPKQRVIPRFFRTTSVFVGGFLYSADIPMHLAQVSDGSSAMSLTLLERAAFVVAFAMLALLLMFYRKKRDIAMEQQRQRLEDLITKRTHELAAANERLQHELCERSHVEEALRKSQETVQGIVEHVHIGIALISTDMRILELNRQMRLWFPQIDVGDPPICYQAYNTPPRDQVCPWCPTVKTFADGQAHEQITETPFGDKVRNYRVASSPLRDKYGNLVAAIELVEDITARYRAEQELKQYRQHLEALVEQRTTELSTVNEELRRANRLKDEFLAGMSHELRTPLHTVLGMAEALSKGVFGDLPDKANERLTTILTSGEQLLQMINDLLDLAKINVQKLEFQMSPVSVRTICRASLLSIVPLAQKKQITIIEQYDHAIQFQADAVRVKQILVNLLVNAVKFTPEGGTIGLEVYPDPNEQQLVFVVWDTGIGIAKEDQPYLFQLFLQLDGGLTRQYGGTGLGLFLAARLVELHNGKISVESEHGQGSRFLVAFPWNAA